MLAKRAGAIDIRNLDFYEILAIKKAIEGLPEEPEERKGWSWPGNGSDDDLKALWMPPVEQGAIELMSDSSTHVTEIVHHSLDDSSNSTPDLLRKKMESLEYWDKGRKIIVLDRKHDLYSGKNPFAEAGIRVPNPVPFRQLVEPPEGVLWNGPRSHRWSEPTRRSGHDQLDPEDFVLRRQSYLFETARRKYADADDPNWYRTYPHRRCQRRSASRRCLRHPRTAEGSVRSLGSTQ